MGLRRRESMVMCLTALTQYTSVTDGETDRQTDRQRNCHCVSQFYDSTVLFHFILQWNWTSSSVVAERPCCRVCQFWPKYMWQSFGYFGHCWTPNWIYSLSRSCPSSMHSFLVTSINITIYHMLLKARFFGLHFCGRHSRSVFNHFDVIDPKATEFGDITQSKGYYVVQCHSKSPILVPIEKTYATSY